MVMVSIPFLPITTVCNGAQSNCMEIVWKTCKNCTSTNSYGLFGSTALSFIYAYLYNFHLFFIWCCLCWLWHSISIKLQLEWSIILLVCDDFKFEFYAGYNTFIVVGIFAILEQFGDKMRIDEFFRITQSDLDFATSLLNS